MTKGRRITIVARQVEKLEIKRENLEKLHIGDCYTYKKLCTILDIPYRSGNQMYSQQEQFSLFFSYEKDKSKFIITNIYDEPLEAEYDYPSNTKYAHLIKVILLQYIAKKPGYRTYITSSQLWYQLGMINGYFIKYKKDRENIIKINPSMTKFEINDFYSRCGSKFSSIVASAFSSLQNQKLIDVDKVTRIEEICLEDNGNYNIVVHDASDLEKKEVMRIERQVLNELGLSSIKQIGFHKDSAKYYERTAELFKEEFGWDNVYKAFKIIYNKDDVIEAISKEDLEYNKKILNGRIIETINQNACNNYDKFGLTSTNMIEMMMDNGGTLPEGQFYYPASYIDKQNWLTDTLIKIKD